MLLRVFLSAAHVLRGHATPRACKCSCVFSSRLRMCCAGTQQRLVRACVLLAAPQAQVFILAGYETTANALAFAVHAISSHPEVEQKLLAEVDAVLAAAGPDAPLDEEMLAKVWWRGCARKGAGPVCAPLFGFPLSPCLPGVHVPWGSVRLPHRVCTCDGQDRV
eukprot:12509-Chlamydomonas_euryale.AAC.1